MKNVEKNKQLEEKMQQIAHIIILFKPSKMPLYTRKNLTKNFLQLQIEQVYYQVY